MADYRVTDTELTSIADAIRAKTGGSAALEFPAEFVSEIGNIPTGLSLTYAAPYDTNLDAAEDASDIVDLPILSGNEKIIIGFSTNGAMTFQNQIFGFYFNTTSNAGVYAYDNGGHLTQINNNLTWDAQNKRFTASAGGAVFADIYYILAFE